MNKLFRKTIIFNRCLRVFVYSFVTIIIVGCLIAASTPTETEKTAPVVDSEEVTTEVEIKESAPVIDEMELYMLAHLLNGEAGASWCSDEMIYYVGSVVLNRVKSDYFPNTLEGVIFQKGQYASTQDGNYYKEPTERCYQIAEQLLLNGSILPGNVVFQAEFKQGSGVYAKVQNQYFCYR